MTISPKPASTFLIVALIPIFITAITWLTFKPKFRPKLIGKGGLIPDYL